MRRILACDLNGLCSKSIYELRLRKKVEKRKISYPGEESHAHGHHLNFVTRTSLACCAINNSKSKTSSFKKRSINPFLIRLPDSIIVVAALG